MFIRKKLGEKETKQTHSPDKIEESGEDTRFQVYLRRLFEEGDASNEDRLLFISKVVLFGLLLLVEMLILLQYAETLITEKSWAPISVLFGATFVLTVAEGLKLFVLKQDRYRKFFYFIEVSAACGFIVVSEGVYSLLLYMLMLTQFYLSAPKSRSALWMYALSLPLYAVSYTMQVYFTRGHILSLEIVREGLAVFSALTLHFIASQIILVFYRQYVRLNRALVDLEKSKKELQKSYDAVAEVTVLEERQRIAKEIHDTAGHSLTTVIMQTEAAKRIIDQDPAEAKQKLIAANLQAKNALERLRSSVHLLSGQMEKETLKESMGRIINESSDGTGINIRSAIEDVTVSQAKHRFICNTLKEGISNGLRHGNAKAFWVELKIEGGKIKFLLSDNGSGLDMENFESGFGLTTMRDRARALGGEMMMMSEPGEGVELSVTLPVDEQR